MVSAMAEEKSLTKEDIVDLQKLLDDLQKDKK
jgi:predicted transcriptional regulator